MTPFNIIVYICVVWNVFGLCILGMIEASPSSPIYWCKDCSFFHYWWLRDNYEYNRFGITVMFIFLNALCPIATICHWVYYGVCKLFTI